MRTTLAALLLGVLSVGLVLTQLVGPVRCMTPVGLGGIGFETYQIWPGVCDVERIAPVWVIGLVGLGISTAVLGRDWLPRVHPAVPIAIAGFGWAGLVWLQRGTPMGRMPLAIAALTGVAIASVSFWRWRTVSRGS